MCFFFCYHCTFPPYMCFVRFAAYYSQLSDVGCGCLRCWCLEHLRCQIATSGELRLGEYHRRLLPLVFLDDHSGRSSHHHFGDTLLSHRMLVPPVEVTGSLESRCSFRIWR